MMRKLSTLLSLAALIFFATAFMFNENATAAGKVTGGKMTVHPDWFKESFLEIAEDVEVAADSPVSQ